MAYVEIGKVIETARDGCHSDFGMSMADLTSLRELLEDTPTADVVEVRHGQWIDGKCGHYKICSECKQITDFDFDYCPNCGAKMDGKDGK